ncbi:hypothetical protein HKCCE2091_20010 [Rhodobacterales bacterium HKCCE2091]|nr:hypothetical protein [Rhodobacterales bacterium HKCCE2091]
MSDLALALFLVALLCGLGFAIWRIAVGALRGHERPRRRNANPRSDTSLVDEAAPHGRGGPPRGFGRRDAEGSQFGGDDGGGGGGVD